MRGSLVCRLLGRGPQGIPLKRELLRYASCLDRFFQ